jgi:hypothetical protein
MIRSLRKLLAEIDMLDWANLTWKQRLQGAFFSAFFLLSFVVVGVSDWLKGGRRFAARLLGRPHGGVHVHGGLAEPRYIS